MENGIERLNDDRMHCKIKWLKLFEDSSIFAFTLDLLCPRLVEIEGEITAIYLRRTVCIIIENGRQEMKRLKYPQQHNNVGCALDPDRKMSRSTENSNRIMDVYMFFRQSTATATTHTRKKKNICMLHTYFDISRYRKIENAISVYPKHLEWRCDKLTTINASQLIYWRALLILY